VKTSAVRLVIVTLLAGLLASEARAAWQVNGNVVCSGPGFARRPAMVSDGAGGAIVAWDDDRSDVGDVYVQRLNAMGVPQWAAGGVAVAVAPGWQGAPQLTSDLLGGAIIVWPDTRTTSLRDIYVQRVNASGIPQWTANGVAIRADLDSTTAWEPVIASDGLGGAIIAWDDVRDGSGSTSWDIYVQRVAPAGVPVWTPNGVPLCTFNETQYDPFIVQDDVGGAIVAWVDNRFQFNTSIFAQRVTSSGMPAWTADGISICQAGGDQSHPVVKRGSTVFGAIIAWEDHRLGHWDIYAQRVDLAGNVLWQANGEPVSSVANGQRYPEIISDGSGGAVIAWEDQRNGTGDIYAQRIDATAANYWLLNGALVCAAPDEQTMPRLVGDGAGGAVITWLDHRSGTHNDIYAQRMAGSGGFLWTFNGAPIVTSVGDKAAPDLISDGGGFGIVGWEDYRSVDGDIYAQRVEFTYGQWGGPEPVLNAIVDMPLDQGSFVELEWAAADRDVVGDPLIDYYSVWRGTDAPGGTLWEEIGTQDATAQATYAMIVPTLFNWPAAGPAEHQFKVLSHATENPEVTWSSAVLTGHSVDNLAPPAPPFLTAWRLASGDVELHWNQAAAPDLDHYSIYRSTSPGVVPSGGTFLANSPDTFAVDTDPAASSVYYVVTAHDVNGNEGSASNEAQVGPVTGMGDAPALASLTVLANVPNPFSASTTLRIGLPRDAQVAIDVFDVAGRRVLGRSLRLGAGWRDVAIDARSEFGPLPSGVYFYRVTAAGETRTRKMVIER
jgi:hypothetical protein